MQSMIQKKSFHFSFSFTKIFLYGYSQFWKNLFLDKYKGYFVCMYDAQYALVIVTEPNRE